MSQSRRLPPLTTRRTAIDGGAERREKRNSRTVARTNTRRGRIHVCMKEVWDYIRKGNAKIEDLEHAISTLEEKEEKTKEAVVEKLRSLKRQEIGTRRRETEDWHQQMQARRINIVWSKRIRSGRRRRKKRRLERRRLRGAGDRGKRALRRRTRRIEMSSPD